MQENGEAVDIPGLERVNRHDHLCLLYDGDTDILAPVIPFIQKGVALGERCVYLNAGADTLERVLKNALSGQKHDIGALKLLPVQETWLKGGCFDPGRVSELLRGICAGSAADGFKGTRIICEMGWAGRDLRWMELLNQFELSLNRFAQLNEVTLLCLYNRQSFTPERMLELAKIHRHLVIGGQVCDNPLFQAAEPNVRSAPAACELDLFLEAVQSSTAAAADREKLRQELEQAYAALARKIYENWQEEDTLRASEKELQEKDEALLAHKRRVQTILQHIPAIMMAFDATGSLAACNHEFERVTGFRPEEVMGKSMLELIRVEEELSAQVVAAHPPQGGNYRGQEWEIKCKDGSLKSVSWSNISRYVPIPGWSNWIIGQDETPRIHAEISLRSMKEELDARTGELEAFGYVISHDLSSLLAKISGYCATMQEAFGLTPKIREISQGIQEATLGMVERIAALQSLTALAAGGLQLEEVDLSAIASEIAAQLSDSGGERPVTFRIENGVTATGDRKLLRLALEQLLENACNYTVGVLHPVIQFGTARVEGELSYFVSDNGPRFSETMGRQAPLKKQANPEGFFCGIGFATVQRIISLHRGRIWSADEAGKGRILYFQV
jgi:PAS domain S-box-containing protein